MIGLSIQLTIHAIQIEYIELYRIVFGTVFLLPIRNLYTS